MADAKWEDTADRVGAWLARHVERTLGALDAFLADAKAPDADGSATDAKRPNGECANPAGHTHYADMDCTKRCPQWPPPMDTETAAEATLSARTVREGAALVGVENYLDTWAVAAASGSPEPMAAWGESDSGVRHYLSVSDLRVVVALARSAHNQRALKVDTEDHRAPGTTGDDATEGDNGDVGCDTSDAPRTERVNEADRWEAGAEAREARLRDLFLADALADGDTAHEPEETGWWHRVDLYGWTHVLDVVGVGGTTIQCVRNPDTGRHYTRRATAPATFLTIWDDHAGMPIVECPFGHRPSDAGPKIARVATADERSADASAFAKPGRPHLPRGFIDLDADQPVKRGTLNGEHLPILDHFGLTGDYVTVHRSAPGSPSREVHCLDLACAARFDPTLKHTCPPRDPGPDR